jgi:hypothetical protein
LLCTPYHCLRGNAFYQQAAAVCAHHPSFNTQTPNAQGSNAQQSNFQRPNAQE